MKNNFALILLVTFFTVHFSLFTASGQSPVKIYNEDQNVRADLKKATELAKKENKHVLAQLGGNWCPWCIRFHHMANGAKQVDSLLKADYVYMLINIPQDKKKRDYKFFRDYGYPNRFGYPVFLVLNGNGQVLHIQDSGVLEHCQVKGYDTTKVVTFLKMWNVKALEPATYK